MLNYFKKNWYIWLGIFIFVYILAFKVDWQKIREIFLTANIWLILGVIILNLVMILIQAWRWNWLKRVQNINYKFIDSFLFFGAGVYLGIITPGRIGDLIKIAYLKKDNYSIGRSSLNVILDRLADIFFLLILGGVGLILISDKIFNSMVVWLIIILSALIIIFLVLIYKKQFLLWLVPKKYKNAWTASYTDFVTDLKLYKFKDYLILFGFTLLAWSIYFGQMYLLAQSINLFISLDYLIVAVTAAAIVAFLPISIYGLGTREATLIYFFSKVDITTEKTLSFSILILIVFLTNAIFGLICWLKVNRKNKLLLN